MNQAKDCEPRWYEFDTEPDTRISTNEEKDSMPRKVQTEKIERPFYIE